MSSPSSAVPEPPKGQHIFPATRLTELATKWRESVAAAKHDEAHALLEEIIIGSTAMFERLAQYEGFTNTVELSALVQAAREKVARWLLAWEPSKPLFTFFSVCARHAFLSEVNKVNQHRNRFHATGENLEKFFGAEDHGAFKEDAALDVKKKLKNITIRWGDERSAAAIRFAVDCLVDERDHDRVAVIRSICYGFGFSEEISKFYYGWALYAMRDALYSKIRAPFTRQDIFRHKYTYTHLVDLLDIISWEQLVKIISTLGGQRLKIPTLHQLNKLHEDYLASLEIEEAGGDPTTIETVAKRIKRPVKTAGEAYADMLRTVSPDRDGEYDLYPHGI